MKRFCQVHIHAYLMRPRLQLQSKRTVMDKGTSLFKKEKEKIIINEPCVKIGRSRTPAYDSDIFWEDSVQDLHIINFFWGNNK